MTSNNQQEGHNQLNYSDHLKRVRQVKRTLDVVAPPVRNRVPPDPASPAGPFFDGQGSQPDAKLASKSVDPRNMKPVGRDHISHESLQDQAISRKTRRPAEDYDIAGALLNAEAQIIQSAEPSPESESPAPFPACSPPPQPTLNLPPPVQQEPSKRGRATQFVAKTLMDHNAILKAQALRQKARIEQQIAERKKQPIKIIEPIKARKEVRACPFSWNEAASDVRFKYCGKCQATIYSFEGLELAEAEKLVFTRENRKNFELFKRPDGKFMTSDCPVERKKKQQLIGAVAICICLIVCVVGFLLMMPPSGLVGSDNPFGQSAPDPVSSSNWSDDPPASGSNTTATKSGDGVQHYEAGDVLPAEPTSAGVDTNSPAPRSITDSEENGDFWEFSGQ